MKQVYYRLKSAYQKKIGGGDVTFPLQTGSSFELVSSVLTKVLNTHSSPKDLLKSEENVVGLEHWASIFLPSEWVSPGHECLEEFITVCTQIKTFLAGKGELLLFCPGDSPSKFALFIQMVFGEELQNVTFRLFPFSCRPECQNTEKSPIGDLAKQTLDFHTKDLQGKIPVYVMDYSFRGHTLRFIMNHLKIPENQIIALQDYSSDATLRRGFTAVYNAEDYGARCVASFKDQKTPLWKSWCDLFVLFVASYYYRRAFLTSPQTLAGLCESAKQLTTTLRNTPTEWRTTTDIQGIHPEKGRFVVKNHTHEFSNVADARRCHFHFVPCREPDCVFYSVSDNKLIPINSLMVFKV